MPIAVTKENFEQEITKSPLPVVIDIFATWCGPCQQMAPHFAELEKEHGSKYKFAKINVDEAREISIQYGVTSIPTFIFIKNGSVQGKATGYMSKDDLLARIREALG
jgi:thioredoxin 1